jgi:ribosome-binding protein aMBF1 (putative translation factor)
MEHACNPNTLEPEAGGSEVQGHPWLYNELQASLGMCETLSQSKAKQSKAKQSKAKQSKAKQSKAKQSKTKQTKPT